MPATEVYQLAQNRKLSISRPRPLAAIGGDNGTPFFLFFPYLPPGMQWVFPQIYGFLYPLPVAMPVGGFWVDAGQFPSGATAPPTGGTQMAQLTAWADAGVPFAFSPGAPASSQAISRWNINSNPASGTKASATRAASPGVTHVGDSFVMRTISTGAAGAGAVGCSIINGPSGGASFLLTTALGISATSGNADGLALGPGLQYRTGPGVALTIEFAVGVANTGQSVSLAGIDQ